VRKLNQRQIYWFFYLAHFDFTLCHYPGQSIGKLDILSQRPDHGNRALDNKNIILLCPELLVIQALERLELTRVKHSILAKVYKSNCSRDQKELVAKAALEL